MMTDYETDNSDLYGIDINHGTYKVVEKEVGLPNTYVINSGGSVDNDNSNLIAIIVIFMVITVLIGIVCFMFGSSVGGGIGYNHGKKSVINKDYKEGKRKYGLMNMDENV